MDQSNYSKKDYWENRFQQTEGYFDWYVGWNELREYITPLINKESVILNIGCGNSKFSEQMYLEDYQNVYNIDISDTVIDKMNVEKNKKNFDKLRYEVMDCTKLNYNDSCFDLTIDKGTFDALSCDKTDEKIALMLNEMLRVTKPGGVFMIVTHSGPHLRLPLFLEYLPFGSYELDYKKVELSMMSEFINSIKSHKKNKNVSMKDALKDKAILLDSLIDVCSRKKKVEKAGEHIKEDKIDSNIDKSDSKQTKEDKMEKLVVYLKIMKALKDKKQAKFNTELNELNESNDVIKENKDIEVIKLSKVNNENNQDNSLKSQISNTSNKSDIEIASDQTAHAQIVDNQNNQTNDPLRRSHCNLFIFKKINNQ